MITGTVVGLRPLVGVTLRLPDRPDIDIECIVDTGFEGAIDDL
jgi:predicted aspartyl protease